MLHISKASTMPCDRASRKLVLGLVLCICAVQKLRERQYLHIISLKEKSFIIAGNQSHHDTCTPSCSCSKVKYFKLRTNFTLQNLYRISSSNHSSSKVNNTDAVCVWEGRRLHVHFPHWLQIMARCWSWWEIHNTQAAVLKIRNETMQFWNHSLIQSPFVSGLWSIMQHAKNVSLVQETSTTTRFNNTVRAMPTPPSGWSLNDDLTMPWFATLETAQSLRRTVLNTMFPTRRNSHCNDENSPRLGVLDRLGSRHLINYQDIVTHLQALTSTPVVYATFENASFEQQVDFFSSIDILVSPHGAQLTGVLFMPRCGSVLELLPRYYHFHYFFGSLTANANLTHAYIYLSDGDAEEDMKNISSQASRKKARSVQLCPPVSSIVSGVETLIGKWKSCCANIGE